jgi:hypothetical protein
MHKYFNTQFYVENIMPPKCFGLYGSYSGRNHISQYIYNKNGFKNIKTRHILLA